jgi:4-amino-4-deoxy-L-arabinose transferase-like glycosyltransferase
MLLALPWVRSGGRRGLFLGGLFLGLAVLAKGLVPLVLIAPLVWVGRRRWRDLLMMGAAAAAVAAPWYILVWLENGDPFVQVFFWKHHFSRFVSEEVRHVQPWWYYIPVGLGLLFPWTPALVALRGADWREPRRLLLIACAAWGFVFFSLSSNKLPGYVLPLLPAIAALIGIQFAQKPLRHVAGVCALLVVAVPFAANILPAAILAGLSRAGEPDIDWLAVGAVITAAAGVWVIERLRSTAAAMASTGALMAASIVGLIWTTYPALDQGASARPWWISMSSKGEVPCVDALHRGLRYGVYYYAGRELPACTGNRERNHDILDRDSGESR